MALIINNRPATTEETRAYRASLPPAEMVGAISALMAEVAEAARAEAREASREARAAGLDDEARAEMVAEAIEAAERRFEGCIKAAERRLDNWWASPEGVAAARAADSLPRGVIVETGRRLRRSGPRPRR